VPGLSSRRIGAGAAALLAAALGAACTGPAGGRVQRTNLITGSTGSSWFTIGSAVAERTNQILGGHPVNAIPGAGGISNPARLARLPGDVGLSFAPVLRAAQRGEAPYTTAYPTLRHVATLIENKLHVIAAERIGVSSVADVVSRRLPVRIGTGPPGSGEEFLLRELLRHYGASYEELRSWGGRIDLLGTSERTDAWMDGHIDVIVFSINDPAPAVTELLTSTDGVLLSLDEAARADLEQRWHVLPRSIPAGAYPKQPAEVRTLGLASVLFTTEDVDADLVYAMTRAVAENKPYLESVHAGFREWTPQRMAQSEGVPVHPGAQRYYAEKGWIAAP
jgi:uncharacterized protein